MIRSHAQWRETAEQLLHNLSDASWRLLLREFCWREKRVNVLWFLNSAQITEAMLRNVSRGVSQQLADDLLYDYKGRDPDLASPGEIQTAIADLECLLDLRSRLADEGHIERPINPATCAPSTVPPAPTFTK